jgi:tetrahydromethanopterin S-methyltransferase subunit B
MSPTVKKLIGVVLICITALGFLLSIFVLFQVWNYRQPVINGLQVGLDHTTTLLQTTDEGLYIIDQVVSNVYTSTLLLNDSTKALAQTMQSTTDFMDSAGQFVGQDLINTITNTQTALDSAQSSAKVIDNVLSSIASVPLLGLQYNPGTPLNTAIGNVSDSLDPVQQSLTNFQTNLDTTISNVQGLTDQVNELDSKINTINSNLSSARATIKNYRTQEASLRNTLANAKANLATWITGLATILTIIILLLIVLQIGLFLQGITLLMPEHSTTEIKQLQE